MRRRVLCALCLLADCSRHAALAIQPARQHASVRSRPLDTAPQLAALPPKSGSSPDNFQVLALGLFKNIVGAGIFALPANAAAGVGFVPALALTLIMGAISAWTFFILGKASAETSSSTYAELWSRTVGPGSVGVIDAAVIVQAFGTCVQYTATICSLIGQLAPEGLIPSWTARVLLTSAYMLPLVTASDLSDLGTAAAIGVAGIVYSALFCCYRLLFAGATPSPRPQISLLTPRQPLAILPFLGSLNTVFLAHLSVPRYWDELNSKSLTTFAALVRAGFGASVIASVIVLSAGYLTFGDACRGLLLDMYPTTDVGAQLMRLMTIVSVVGGYPMIFIALRDAATTQLRALQRRTHPGKYSPEHTPTERSGRTFERLLSLVLLGLVTLTSVFARDVRLLISLRGALLGSIITLVLPPLVMLHSPGSRPTGRGLAHLCSRALIVYGLVSSVLGTIACVLQG